MSEREGSDRPEVPPAEPAPEAPHPDGPPDGPPEGGEPEAPEPRRRRALPWVLLGIGGAILLAAGVLVAVFVIPSFVGGGTDPAATVRDFDNAYRDADCELYQSTTTERFRESAQGVDDSGVFDCDLWVEFAEGYTVGDEYQYTLEVISSEVEGDTAEVITHEVDRGTDEEFDYEYTLVQGVEGAWLIDSIAVAVDGADPGGE